MTSFNPLFSNADSTPQEPDFTVRGLTDDGGIDFIIVEFPAADFGSRHEALLEHLRQSLREIVAESPGTPMLLDLHRVRYAGAAFLGALAVAAKLARDNRNDLVACGSLQTLFEVTRLCRMIPIYGTRREALESLQSRACRRRDENIVVPVQRDVDPMLVS